MRSLIAYLCMIVACSAAGLTGEARKNLVSEASQKCLDQISVLTPTQALNYCDCTAEGLADRLDLATVIDLERRRDTVEVATKIRPIMKEIAAACWAALKK